MIRKQLYWMMGLVMCSPRVKGGNDPVPMKRFSKRLPFRSHRKWEHAGSTGDGR